VAVPTPEIQPGRRLVQLQCAPVAGHPAHNQRTREPPAYTAVIGLCRDHADRLNNAVFLAIPASDRITQRQRTFGCAVSRGTVSTPKTAGNAAVGAVWPGSMLSSPASAVVCAHIGRVTQIGCSLLGCLTPPGRNARWCWSWRPHSLCTAAISAPASNRSLTNVRRKSCGENPFTPASWSRFCIALYTAWDVGGGWSDCRPC
jgi:hypothetical protein